MKAIQNQRCFVGVVSLEHAERGYEGGFTQACHGKKSPLSRMKAGDWFVQYSPKYSMEEKRPYQKFSYLGKVVNGRVYQFAMSSRFKPYRIDIKYLSKEIAKHAPAKPLVDRLSFIDNKKNWGAKFRYGFLEIPKEDFAVIYESMTQKEFDPSLEISDIEGKNVKEKVDMDMKISHTELVKGSPKDVWHFWSNPESWHEWDSGIEWCKLVEGSSFCENAKAQLMAKGAPQPVEMTIIRCLPNEEFVDRAETPLGSMTFSHKVEAIESGVKITHTVSFSPTDQKARSIIEEGLFKKMQEELPKSLVALGKLVEEKASAGS